MVPKISNAKSLLLAVYNTLLQSAPPTAPQAPYIDSRAAISDLLFLSEKDIFHIQKKKKEEIPPCDDSCLCHWSGNIEVNLKGVFTLRRLHQPQRSAE